MIFFGLSGVGLCFWVGNAPKLVSTLPKIAYHILIVTINASSQTGRVTDIYFKYIERSATSNTIGLIPLEKFREIELRVKEELVFEPTEAGAARSYLYLYCTYDVEGLSLDDDTTLEQLKPIDGKLSTEIP